MKLAAIDVQEALQANEALQAVINGNQFWELAPEEQKTPFVNFRLRENKRPGKDAGGNFDLKVYCFESTLTKAADLAELVKTALIEDNYKYQGGESGYTDNEAREGYIELNFNFNI